MSESNERKIVIDLPFDPSKNDVVIFQGFNGPISHKPSKYIDLSHSVDFALPPGTPVTAVEDGIIQGIRRYENSYSGFDPEIGRRTWATNIDITHPDLETQTGRVFSMLQHLDPNSIRVTEGQRVIKGQILANTGLTGWVGPIPHLHLSLVERGEIPFKTLPFDFRNYQGPLDDQANEYLLSLYSSAIGDLILAERAKAKMVMQGI